MLKTFITSDDSWHTRGQGYESQKVERVYMFGMSDPTIHRLYKVCQALTTFRGKNRADGYVLN